MKKLPLPRNKSLRVKRHEKMSSDELKSFMVNNGISEKELCEILGVTIQAVKLWLDGERSISVMMTRVIRLMQKHPSLIREF